MWRTVLALAVLAFPAGARAASPVVVELFTSQGCSSCPPADGFLSDLARQRPDVLPLAFHVTYWDNLGWRDPFAFAAATARQRSYARVLDDHTVYTPEMVVNGRASFVGSDRAAGLAVIAREAGRPDVALRVQPDGSGGLVVSVGAGAGAGVVLLAGYDAAHRTQVGRGEDAGRTLLESNIVRALAPAGSWTGAPVVLHAPAPPGERVAALLQAEDGTILAAALLP